LEVKQALWSIGDDKSPGPAGFSAGFLKAAWSIMNEDVIKAVQD